MISLLKQIFLQRESSCHWANWVIGKVWINGTFPGMKAAARSVVVCLCHKVKKLLIQAIPNLEASARAQLLLHQLLTGLPPAIGSQLKAS